MAGTDSVPEDREGGGREEGTEEGWVGWLAGFCCPSRQCYNRHGILIRQGRGILSMPAC